MNNETYKRYLATRLSNRYTRHYKAHVEDGSLQQRKHNARMKLATMDDLGISDSYFTELLADYILAEDHLRGLSLMREAKETPKDDEEYPPIGEGAQEFHQREWVAGDVITVGERRKVKACEICQCNFIDQSRAFNARVCGQICRDRKDALRKRAEYNQSELGLKNEKRLKRYRVRQDYEYPFYSPLEMYELSARSEQVFSDDKLERKLYRKQQEAPEVNIAGESVSLETPRLYGKRKPMWVSDQFGELNNKAHDYRPSGRNRFVDNDEEKNGPVIVRTISVDVTAEQLEAEKWVNVNKMRGLGILNPQQIKENKKDTSEIYAI